MKKCAYCGSVLHDDDVKCSSCGAAQELNIQEQKQAVNENSLLHEYKRFGYSVSVYSNRLSITDISGSKAGIFAPKVIDIFTKNIASVDIKGLSRSLVIRTTDGKTIDVKVFGKDAEKIRNLITNN